MISKLRIWRVVPTCKTGVQAPSFFVETTEKDSQKAKEAALKQASTMTPLSRFEDWKIQLEKCRMRKDELGRYWTYHQ